MLPKTLKERTKHNKGSCCTNTLWWHWYGVLQIEWELKSLLCTRMVSFVKMQMWWTWFPLSWMRPIDTFVYKNGVVYENVDVMNGSLMRVMKLKNGAHVNNNMVGGLRVSMMVTPKNNSLMCIDIFPWTSDEPCISTLTNIRCPLHEPKSNFYRIFGR